MADSEHGPDHSKPWRDPEENSLETDFEAAKEAAWLVAKGLHTEYFSEESTAETKGESKANAVRKTKGKAVKIGSRKGRSRKVDLDFDESEEELSFASAPGNTSTSGTRNATGTRPPNLGPNPPGHVPQRYTLLDFQDIALFVWPLQRRKSDFSHGERCLILKHRNPRLEDMTEKELSKTMKWLKKSKYITVEAENIDIQAWREQITRPKLTQLVDEMDEDLDRAKAILEYREIRAAQQQSMHD